MLTKEEIIQGVKDGQIFESNLFTKVWLVGSFARNEATEKSDIDFLIEYNIDEIEKANVNGWYTVQDFIEKKFNRPAQLISTDAYEKFENSCEILVK